MSLNLSTFYLQLSADKNIKMSQARDGNLEVELTGVKPADSGNYSCTVTLTTGETLTTSGNLTITDAGNDKSGAPVFTNALTDKHVKDGEPVSLECEVKGSPRPQISWFKGNTEILDSQVSGDTTCLIRERELLF